MANDDFDNSRTDAEMLAKLRERAEAEHPGASIDIRTGPYHAQIYMNRPAVVDLIKKLQIVVGMCLETTNVCMTFAQGGGTTLLSIDTDDSTTPN